MADRRVLVDTSVIIEFLRKTHKEDAWLWYLQENSVCYMSSITLFELYSGAKTEQHRDDIRKLRAWILSLFFDDEISEVAGIMFRELRQANQQIEYRDLFIAATAKVYDCHVATLNIRHFARIEGLRLLNKA